MHTPLHSEDAQVLRNFVEDLEGGMLALPAHPDAGTCRDLAEQAETIAFMIMGDPNLPLDERVGLMQLSNALPLLRRVQRWAAQLARNGKEIGDAETVSRMVSLVSGIDARIGTAETSAQKAEMATLRVNYETSKIVHNVAGKVHEAFRQRSQSA